MESNVHACCFTGHRPNRLPWLQDQTDLRTQALIKALWERIRSSYEHGYTRYLSGMARGIDLLCAQLVLQLQAEDEQVELIPVLPFPNQARGWPVAEQKCHREILHTCRDQIVIISPVYSRTCFYERNRYLVDHSSKIIGVYDGTPSGGTHQTLEYARQKNLEMELLMPE